MSKTSKNLIRSVRRFLLYVTARRHFLQHPAVVLSHQTPNSLLLFLLPVVLSLSSSSSSSLSVTPACRSSEPKLSTLCLSPVRSAQSCSTASTHRLFLFSFSTTRSRKTLRALQAAAVMATTEDIPEYSRSSSSSSSRVASCLSGSSSLLLDCCLLWVVFSLPTRLTRVCSCFFGGAVGGS